jgi:nicotinamide-nucleotide amidase
VTETLSPVLPDEVERMTHALLQAACDRNLTLATAESCTGGLLASLLTDVEGVSHAFERGFVVYTEEAKAELLGIDPELIGRCGAVSREVAVAMAEGALSRSKADIALAVTGFAGSGGNSDEPGLVHLAVAKQGRETQHREERFGDIGRGRIRIASIRTALTMMRDMLD